MTDNEFNVLDELYFVHTFEHLKKELGFTDDLIISTLKILRDKGWVKFLKDVDAEWEHDNLSVEDFEKSYFLATKSGLLAHNS